MPKNTLGRSDLPKPSPIAQSAIVSHHPPSAPLPPTIRRWIPILSTEGMPASGDREHTLSLLPADVSPPPITRAKKAGWRCRLASRLPFLARLDRLSHDHVLRLRRPKPLPPPPIRHCPRQLQSAVPPPPICYSAVQLKSAVLPCRQQARLSHLARLSHDHDHAHVLRLHHPAPLPPPPICHSAVRQPPVPSC